MSFEHPGAGALDYFPCRYGLSKTMFRGPRQRIEGRYAVALGGIETYGKFIATPWPLLVERATGRQMVNLGCLGAGIDAYLNDPPVMQLAAAAELRVLQVMGAQGLSNRFYVVHPRRNDRFLRATPALQRLYPEVDFTEFAFVRHMIQGLLRRDADRFAVVADELRDAWVWRMKEFLSQLGGPTILLWFADRAPGVPGVRTRLSGQSPLMVDAGMLETMRPQVVDIVQVVSPPHIGPAEGMIYHPLDELVAAELPGPASHERVAAALVPMMAVAG